MQDPIVSDTPQPQSVTNADIDLSAISFGISNLPNLSSLSSLSHPTQGKQRHSDVNRLVWGFREYFHFDSTVSEPRGGERYRSAVDRFENILIDLLPEKTRAEINQFASPDHYREVRGAYRMRASRMVSEEELLNLTHEIKAALIWREITASLRCAE